MSYRTKGENENTTEGGFRKLIPLTLEKGESLSVSSDLEAYADEPRIFVVQGLDPASNHINFDHSFSEHEIKVSELENGDTAMQLSAHNTIYIFKGSSSGDILGSIKNLATPDTHTEDFDYEHEDFSSQYHDDQSIHTPHQQRSSDGGLHQSEYLVREQGSHTVDPKLAYGLTSANDNILDMDSEEVRVRRVAPPRRPSYQEVDQGAQSKDYESMDLPKNSPQDSGANHEDFSKNSSEIEGIVLASLPDIELDKQESASEFIGRTFFDNADTVAPQSVKSGPEFPAFQPDSQVRLFKIDVTKTTVVADFDPENSIILFKYKFLLSNPTVACDGNDTMLFDNSEGITPPEFITRIIIKGVIPSQLSESNFGNWENISQVNFDEVFGRGSIMFYDSTEGIKATYGNRYIETSSEDISIPGEAEGTNYAPKGGFTDIDDFDPSVDTIDLPGGPLMYTMTQTARGVVIRDIRYSYGETDYAKIILKGTYADELENSNFGEEYTVDRIHGYENASRLAETFRALSKTQLDIADIENDFVLANESEKINLHTYSSPGMHDPSDVDLGDTTMHDTGQGEDMDVYE